MSDDEDIQSKWRFEATDNAGFTGYQATDDVDLYLEFKAQVVDKDTQKVVAEKANYWIKIVGRYERTISNGGFN